MDPCLRYAAQGPLEGRLNERTVAKKLIPKSPMRSPKTMRARETMRKKKGPVPQNKNYIGGRG